MTVEPQIFYARMHQRQDTAANWAAENPVLAPGEFGIQYDSAAPQNIGLKLGRGQAWSSTPFIQISEALPTDLDYDASSRLLTSSTGEDVTLPLVGTVVGGTPVAGLQTAAEAARLAETGSPTFAGLTVAAGGIAYLPHIHGALAGSLYQHVRNDTGESLASLTPYRVTGSQGATDRVLIVAARADNAALMPASGITSEALAVNGDGHGVVEGEILGVNTAGLTAGAPLYVAATGGLTPTAPTTRAQMVAVVGRVHATTGSILVQIGTMRPTIAEVEGLQTALDAKAPLTLTVIQVAYTATINIDFSAYNGAIVVVSTLTGNLQITFSNIAAGRTCAVALTCDATQRTLTFPAGAPFFGIKPATIAASKQMRLSFECIGGTEATVHCAAAAQA